LKRLIGYEWPQGCEFPPRHRAISEIAGATATAQLKEAIYTDGGSAIPVMPSYFATAHKDEQQYAEENEVRIEVVIPPETAVVRPDDKLIRWQVASFGGLQIALTDQIPSTATSRIVSLAAELKIPIG
jgi:hypothetical protein